MGIRSQFITQRLILAMAIALVNGGAWLAAQTSAGTNDFVYALLKLVPDDAYKNTGLTVFPILSLPLGGEQAALGNAYTAVSRDVSYLAANPAAGPLQEQAELAVFHSTIISDVNLETLAWSDRWGDISAGAYLKLLTAEFTAVDITGQQTASNGYVETMLAAGASYTFFRDYNFSGLSVGATLKLMYRSIPKEFYAHITRLAGSDQSAIGFAGDIGLLTRFNFLKFDVTRDKNFSIGVALKDLGPAVMEDAMPTTLSAGLAWQPFRPLLISGDFNLPINLVDVSKSEAPGFAIGLAGQFVNFLSVKAGFQYKGGNPRITAGVDLDLSSNAGVPLSFIVTYTLDLSTTFKIPDHLSIQARLELGDNGRQAQSKKVDDLYIAALVAAASGDWEQVIKLCEEALAIDPGFIPAKGVMTQAKTSLDLVRQIESIRVDDKLPTE